MPLPVPAEHRAWMARAVTEAGLAPEHGDVPVGAVVVDTAGRIIAVAHNEKELHNDPTAHAEVLAVRRAAEATGNWHLEGATIVVTLEPCVMCAGAILAARLEAVVFGAWDDKAGAAGSRFDLLRDRTLNHQTLVTGGVMAEECAGLLEGFFRARR